jgi:CO dehydrogenase maturation factor
MKIAISGKGGVGKSTLAAALALLLARRGQKVVAVDADPDANLASALGISESAQAEIIPISRQVALIEERTGAKVKQYGQVFKLNPEVSDIVNNFATVHNGIALLVLGAVERGGSGCACPENVLLRALITDLILYKDETIVLDMEAGVEHLGRATAKGVDLMLVVVEPGQRSIESTRRILRMAEEIGLRQIKIVANKIATDEDFGRIQQAFPEHEIIGVIPFADEIRRADRDGKSVLDGLSAPILEKLNEITEKVKSA